MSLLLGWRRLRATPGFAVFAVATLALGIGVTTAIYSIVRAVLAPPPGVTTLDRLVTINHSSGGSVPLIALSYGDYLDLRARQRSFEDVAGWAFHRQSLAADGRSVSGFGEIVSGEYFHVLGVGPEVGRVLQPADDSPSAPPVAVLSYLTWQRLFDGRPDIAGRTIRVNGGVFEIVGVASRAFAGLFNNGLVPSTAWIPMSAAAGMPEVVSNVRFDPLARSSRNIQVRARLRRDVTIDQARAEIAAIAAQLNLEAPLGADRAAVSGRSGRSQDSRPWIVQRSADVYLNEGADRVVRPMAAAILAAVGLVLLVACTNLANLMLARHSRRRTEAGVRLALGSSRLRLVRESLAETVLIAIAGGAAGVGVARVLLVMLGQDLYFARGVSLHAVPRIDLAALSAAAIATLLTLVIAGILPALSASRVDLRAATAADTGGASPRWRGRRYLIALQVTVSVVLTTLASLSMAHVRAQRAIDTGIDLDRLAFVDVDFRLQQYPEERVRQILEAALGRLDARSGVEAAAASSGLPFGIGTPGAGVSGGALARARSRSELVAATPGIFEVLGIAIVRGRAFDERDTAASGPVVVIDERTADELFGDANPLGATVTVQRTRWAGEEQQPAKTVTVIGVAAAASAGSLTGGDGVVYLPLAQHYEPHLVLSARAAGDAEAAAGQLRRTVASIDPGLAVAQTGTGETFLGELTLFYRVVAAISGVLGTLALVVALAGLFGVLSHLVASRSRELGIRLALGAGGHRIMAMVLREGLSPVLVGLVGGFGLAALARMGLQPMFQRLMPSVDVGMLVLVLVLFIGAGAFACYLPARRAASVDPNVALRDL